MQMRIALLLALALVVVACEPRRTTPADQIGDIAPLPSGPVEDPECDGSDCTCEGAADCFTMASYECTEVECDPDGCVGHGCSPPSPDPVPPPPDP